VCVVDKLPSSQMLFYIHCSALCM